MCYDDVGLVARTGLCIKESVGVVLGAIRVERGVGMCIRLDSDTNQPLSRLRPTGHPDACSGTTCTRTPLFGSGQVLDPVMLVCAGPMQVGLSDLFQG